MCRLWIVNAPELLNPPKRRWRQVWPQCCSGAWQLQIIMGFFFHLCGIRGYLHFKSTQCGYLIRFQTDSRCSCSWRRISPNSGHQYSCRAEESARRRAGGGSVPAALPLWEKLRLRMAHRSSDGWSISIPHIWIYIGRTSLSDTEHLWTFFFFIFAELKFA